MREKDNRDVSQLVARLVWELPVSPEPPIEKCEKNGENGRKAEITRDAGPVKKLFDHIFDPNWSNNKILIGV